MISRLVLLPLLVLASLSIPRPAAAQAAAEGSKVLVFPLTGSVPGDPGDGLAQLTRIVARVAALTEGEVTISQAAFTDAAALAGCETEDAACFAKVAETLRVDGLIVGSVQPGEDGVSVAVTLERYDARSATIDRQSAVVPADSFDALRSSFLREVSRAFVGGDQGQVEPPTQVEPTPPAVAPAPAPEPRDDAFDLRRVGKVPWIVAGAGVALAAVGTVYLIMAQSRQDEVDSAPTQTGADLDRLARLEDEGERYTTIGNVLLIGGVAVAIGGGAWAIYQATRRGPRPAPAVSIAPVPVRGGAALTLTVPLP